MQNTIIQLGRKAATPKLQNPGILLSPTTNPHFKSSSPPLLVHGICRIPKSPNLERRALLSGLTLTAIEIYNQNPTTLNPIGKKLVFEDDIEDIGSCWGACFSIDAIAWLGVAIRPYAFMLHASLYQYVSNVVYLRLEP